MFRALLAFRGNVSLQSHFFRDFYVTNGPSEHVKNPKKIGCVGECE